MLQLGEIFLIGNQKCKVKGESGTYWISWLEIDGRHELSSDRREDFFMETFGRYDMSDIIRSSPENSVLHSIHYWDNFAPDSPDFDSLEDLTEFVEELRKLIFINDFKELILN